jgi:uncharacterized protein YbjT (DUF2867 family)
MNATSPPTIVLAGATGNLGTRIAKALVARGARVIALTRTGSAPAKVDALRTLGVEIALVDWSRVDELASACAGASCVVSALLGLHDVMVAGQGLLLDAAVNAGVPRFIPSDYAMDFTKLQAGNNRNLDLHKEFEARVDRAPIAATSILNGAFMELLVGPAPFVLFKWSRVLYWSNPDQLLDFTAMDDVAAYTARAALDEGAPRFLRVAGAQISSRQLAAIASATFGRPFKLTWAGTVGTLDVMTKLMRTLMPAPSDPMPPWQGMQYSRDMFAGRALLTPLDNDRYPDLSWTSVGDVLASKR